MMTYRYRGHSMSDPAKYRTKDELNEYKNEHDPILQVKDMLLATDDVTEDEIKRDRKGNKDHRQRGGAVRTGIART